MLMLIFIFMQNSTAVFANSAAPIEIHALPSSAMIQTQIAGLMIQKEILKFHCHLAFCDVSATYEFQSESEKNAVFRFILPTPNSLQATNNEQAMTVLETNRLTLNEVQLWDLTTEADGSITESTPEFKKNQWESTPLYETRFSGKIFSGTNHLTVKYSQPLKLQLQRSYLLSAAQGEVDFSYILKPLKQWPRKDGFSLDIELLWDQPQRSFFARLFLAGKRQIRCIFSGSTSAKFTQRFQREAKIEQQVLQYQFKDDFPDTMRCRGDIKPDLAFFNDDVNSLEEEMLKEHQRLRSLTLEGAAGIPNEKRQSR